MQTRNELSYLNSRELNDARAEAQDCGNFILAAEYAREIVTRDAYDSVGMRPVRGALGGRYYE